MNEDCFSEVSLAQRDRSLLRVLVLLRSLSDSEDSEVQNVSNRRGSVILEILSRERRIGRAASSRRRSQTVAVSHSEFSGFFHGIMNNEGYSIVYLHLNDQLLNEKNRKYYFDRHKVVKSQRITEKNTEVSL